MTTPANGPVLGGTIITAVMASMPFGVSFTTLVLGGVCFFGGSCARTGLSLYRKLDGTDPVTLQYFFRSVAMLLCTVPLAAVASCVVFLAAHVAKIEADAAFGGLLLIMGVRGPEGFTWLMDMLTNVFTKFVPGNKPGGGGS
jgi:hypothetical protein